MLKRALVLMIGVLVTGLLLAACGGDNGSDGSESAGNSGGAAAEGGGSSNGEEGGGSEESSGAALSKAAFVKQANQICKEAKKKIGGEVNSAFRGQNNEVEPNAEAITQAILIPGLETELSELQELGIPGGDEEEVEAIFTAIEEIINNGNDNAQTITAESEPYAAAEKPADKYGIDACPLA